MLLGIERSIKKESERFIQNKKTNHHVKIITARTSKITPQQSE
jgi:hypothetical protein